MRMPSTQGYLLWKHAEALTRAWHLVVGKEMTLHRGAMATSQGSLKNYMKKPTEGGGAGVKPPANHSDGQSLSHRTHQVEGKK